MQHIPTWRFPIVRSSRSRHLARVAAAALASLVVAGVVAPATAASAATSSSGPTAVENVFTSRLNQARASQGIPRLTPRSVLVAVARQQAQRMANQGLLYHNPNLTTEVTNWRWVGENVGYGPDARTVHVAFMNSPGHRANILDRDYTEVGVGAVVVGGRVWVAEVFRQPIRVSTTKSILNPATYQHALHYGSTGPAVKRVQARLHIARTGYYGPKTKRAVSRFQQAQGWPGRGVVGRHTWNRLSRPCRPTLLTAWSG